MRVASLVISLVYLAGIGSSVSTIFRLRVRNDVNVLFITANSVLWGLAVIAITARGGGMIPLATAFVAVLALVQWTQALLAVRIAPPRLRGSTKLWRTLAHVGIPVGLGTMLTVAYARVDQLLVFELAPHHSEAGIYGAIYRVLDQAGFVPAAVMTTLFPIISAAHPSDPLRVRRLVQLAIDYLATISLPVLAFTTAAAHPLIHLLFGAAYDRGANAMPALMAAYVVICFGYISGNMIVATNLQRRYVTYALVGLIVNVGLNLMLIPLYGYLAAAWITLLTNVVVIVPALRAVMRELDMRISPRRLLRTAIAATASGIAIAILRDVGVPFGGLVAAMLICYVPLLLVLKAVDLAEIREVMSSRRTT